MIRNTSSSWGSVARSFHWVLGAAVLGMLAYGWWMNHIPARPDRFFHRSIHADIGYLVLAADGRSAWSGAASIRRRRYRPIRRGGSGSRRRSAIGRCMPSTILVAMLGWAHSGAHTPELCRLVRAVSRAADHLTGQGRRRGLRGSPHLLCLCAAGLDRDPCRRGAMASSRETRPRDIADDRRRSGLIGIFPIVSG